MPASALSSSVSWSAYILSSIALLLLLVHPALQLAEAGRVSEARGAVSGVAALINELRPGMTTRFSYGSIFPQPAIQLAGMTVEVVVGNSTIAAPTEWSLPTMSLSPGTEYAATLEGTTVEVTRNE